MCQAPVLASSGEYAPREQVAVVLPENTRSPENRPPAEGVPEENRAPGESNPIPNQSHVEAEEESEEVTQASSVSRQPADGSCETRVLYMLQGGSVAVVRQDGSGAESLFMISNTGSGVIKRPSEFLFMALDEEQGSLYFLDQTSNVVWTSEADGSNLARLGELPRQESPDGLPRGRFVITSVTIDPFGEFYIGSPSYLFRVSSDLADLHTVAHFSEPLTLMPSSIALDSERDRLVLGLRQFDSRLGASSFGTRIVAADGSSWVDLGPSSTGSSTLDGVRGATYFDGLVPGTDGDGVCIKRLGHPTSEVEIVACRTGQTPVVQAFDPVSDHLFVVWEDQTTGTYTTVASGPTGTNPTPIWQADTAPNSIVPAPSLSPTCD